MTPAITKYHRKEIGLDELIAELDRTFDRRAALDICKEELSPSAFKSALNCFKRIDIRKDLDSEYERILKS